MDIENFITGLPKAELHLHIEGTFEPELMLAIAKRNHIKTKYESVEDLKQAYQFNRLQDFLDIYYEGAAALITQQDFYDLTWAYLEKVHGQNVVHVEIFFDPQTHTTRGIAFDTVIQGIYAALEKAEQTLGITSKIILCFLRHLDEASAMQTLETALAYKDKIIGVGLDSSELGHPPSKFQRVFERALQEGFVTVAHAGEEGPATYIHEALNVLKVTRIDHGNRALEDPELVKRLIEQKTPLTICPLSNLYLKVVKDMRVHPIKLMLDQGLLVTVNSDDPAYFGGYMNENYIAITKALNLSKADLCQLAKNAFTASFLDETKKTEWINKVEAYYLSNQ
jgi:adenosine deaminase